MSKAVIQEYDRNGNGSIEQSEAEACPALKAVFEGIDTDRDKKLSADELRTRFEAYRTVGIIGNPVSVYLNGSPLVGAEVKFTPEPCMLGSVLEFNGQTGENGTVQRFRGPDGKEYSGLQAGLYRVAVIKPGDAGGETVPARYNAKTILGAEVYGGRGSSTLKFSLTDP